MSNEAPQENQSEVARLLQIIRLEYEAAHLGLLGLAFGTSQHEFITARMEGVAAAREHLVNIVGPDEATKLMIQQMESPETTQELKENEGDNK